MPSAFRPASISSDFPVLSAGPTPEPDLDTWQFMLGDGDTKLGEWDWAQFNALTQSDITVDIHCVTSWSKLDTLWHGVSIDTLLEAVGLTEPPAPFAIITCEGGYTTNVPSEDLIDGKAMIATHFDGQPLSPEHGGPARPWCRISISGRAQNGCAGSNSAKKTNPASGSSSAITTTATRGASSVMTVTDTAAPRPALRWQTAEVLDILTETPRVKTLLLKLPDFIKYLPGQHVDVRLTADDGYQAQRSYSIASAPEDKHVALTVERIEDGEVSPYFTDEVRAGDRFEMRGPIGRYFVWTVKLEGPLFLIGGGSGVVPLMAMLRHRAAHASTIPARLLYSSRTQGDIIYREELERLAAGDEGLAVTHTLTREKPSGWTGHLGRVDATMLMESGFAAGQKPKIFICGPTGFVEAAANALLAAGHHRATDQDRTLRTDRTLSRYRVIPKNEDLRLIDGTGQQRCDMFSQFSIRLIVDGPDSDVKIVVAFRHIEIRNHA